MMRCYHLRKISMGMVMDFDYLQDCVDATVTTYEKMLGSTPVTVGERYSQTGIINVHDVTALIGFNGEGIGSLLVSMSQENAMKSVSKFLYTELTEVDDDVLDGIEEIANIVAGAAAARFSFKTGLGLPTILLGEKQRIHGNEDAPWLFITMKTEAFGEFTLGATLKEV
jgi:chemotaxis protein CheX